MNSVALYYVGGDDVSGYRIDGYLQDSGDGIARRPLGEMFGWFSPTSYWYPDNDSTLLSPHNSWLTFHAWHDIATGNVRGEVTDRLSGAVLFEKRGYPLASSG